MSEPLRILLIDANSAWLAAGDKGGASQVVLPLGMMYLSAALRRALGAAVEIQLINTAIDVRDGAELARQIQAYAPHVVGFRALSMAKSFFYELAATVRTLLPGATLIAGGPHATCFPEEVMAHPAIDFLVVGEGEVTLVQLVEHLMGRRSQADLRGLFYRRGNQVVQAPPQEPIANLDALPWPDYGILDQSRYASVLSYGYTMRRQGVILSSRGCPFSCKYCAKLMGQTHRVRSPAGVLGEIEMLLADGVRDIMFVDDTFNLNARRTEEIFTGILDRKLQCNYYFPAGLRAELMTPAMVDLFVEAGTCWITYAVETVVPRLLELSGRMGKPGPAAEIIDYTAAKGIMVGLFAMVGFPTETYEEAMTTLEYVRQRKGVTMPYLFSVKYFPDTELTRLALDIGAIDPATVASSASAYHDVSASRTSTLSGQQFAELFTFYMKEILLDSDRLGHALAVQERFLSPAELAAAYSALLGRKIQDPRKTFRSILH